MTCAVIGASAGLGRSLAVAAARAGHDVIAVASDLRDVTAVCSDIQCRYGRRAWPVAADLMNLPSCLQQLHEAVERAGGLDLLLLPAGAVDDGDDGTLAPAEVSRLTQVNFTALSALVSALLPGLLRRPAAAVIGFGSVAAVRGRARNVVYAAAKRAMASFFESLRHRCEGSPVRVHFYVVGYVDTALAYGRVPPFLRGDPDQLARRVLARVRARSGVRYFPAWWRPVTLVLRALPWPLFRLLRS